METELSLGFRISPLMASYLHELQHGAQLLSTSVSYARLESHS